MVYEHTNSISSSNIANLFMVKFIRFHEMKHTFAYFFFKYGDNTLNFVSPFLYCSNFFCLGFFPLYIQLLRNLKNETIDLLNIVNKSKHLPLLDKLWVSVHICFLNPLLDMILWHPMKHTCTMRLNYHHMFIHIKSYKNKKNFLKFIVLN